uniref:Uncharacterized protein n=1 Tax=Anguilla anguilla TaxID=7936 RepID=A0A0E9TJS2_ANGAN
MFPASYKYRRNFYLIQATLR